jgi:hypothetical protein
MIQTDTKVIKYINITLTRIEDRILEIKKFDWNFRRDYRRIETSIEEYIELFESLILNAYSLESHTKSLLERLEVNLKEKPTQLEWKDVDYDEFWNEEGDGECYTEGIASND